jgi:hypothetical protein
MKERMDRLRRIERLQKQMHDLAVWRLTSVARERERLTREHSQMIEAMSEGLMAYGGPAAAGARRVRALERDLGIARDLEANLERKQIEQGARAKLADRAAGAARNEYREALEKKSLEELIASALSMPSASRKS